MAVGTRRRARWLGSRSLAFFKAGLLRLDAVWFIASQGNHSTCARRRFFCIISPMPLVMKMLGRNSPARKLDDSAQSYRVLADSAPANNMEKPY